MKLKNNELSENDYIIQKESVLEEIRKIENQIISLSSSIKNDKFSHTNFINSLAKYKGMNGLTKEMANELIKEILIFNKNEVEIKLNFDDEFANVIDFIKNNVQEEVERFLMKLE